MLCATYLAEIERADPVERRLGVAPISNSFDSSSVTSDQAPIGSPLSPTSLSDSIERGQTYTSTVGVPRDFSGHAEGTTAAYNSCKKWVVAALQESVTGESIYTVRRRSQSAHKCLAR